MLGMLLAKDDAGLVKKQQGIEDGPLGKIKIN